MYKNRVLAAFCIMISILTAGGCSEKASDMPDGQAEAYNSPVLQRRSMESADPDISENILPRSVQPPEDNSYADVYHTVTFMVSNSIYHTATQLEGTLVPLPPDPGGDFPFLTWCLEDGSSVFNPFEPITGDITLNALFGYGHVVRFMNTDGSELEAVVAEDGKAVSKPSSNPDLPSGSSLDYWSIGGTDDEYNFTSPVHSNLTLYPVLKDRAIAVFVTEGPEISPQARSGEFYAVRPKSDLLVRDGYVFSHWSDAEGGSEPFDFENTLITQATFIYAVWTPIKVGYILNYWNEKVNTTSPGDPSIPANRENYEMIYTRTVGPEDGALSGEKPNITAAFANSCYIPGGSNVTELLDYSDFAWADEKELSGLGDTVINVYYKRSKYNFYFDLTKTSDNRTISSYIKLRGSDEPVYGVDGIYKIEGIKLGQDISTLWPLECVREDTNEKPISWNSLYGSGTKTLTPWYLQQAMNKGKTGRPPNNSATLKMNWQAAAFTEVRNYYLELLEGQAPGPDTVSYKAGGGSDLTERHYDWAMESIRSYQRADPERYAQNWPGTSISGFETIGTNLTKYFQKTEFIEETDGVKHYRIDYYMRRLSYYLSLMTGGGMIDVSNGFILRDGYYVNILQYQAPITLSAEPVKADAVFAGWYLDEQLQTPFETGMTMPARNLTLYAKYVGTDVSVNYYDSGQLIKTNSYSFNEPLTAHDLGDTPYEHYSEGDLVSGKGCFTGWYYDVYGVGFTVKMPIGMRLSRTVYDLYAGFDPVEYTVAFVDQSSGSDEIFAEEALKSGLRNTLALHGHYEHEFYPVRDGYSFAGWNAQPDGSGRKFTTATRVVEDQTVYAQWEVKTVPSSDPTLPGSVTSTPGATPSVSGAASPKPSAGASAPVTASPGTGAGPSAPPVVSPGASGTPSAVPTPAASVMPSASASASPSGAPSVSASAPPSVTPSEEVLVSPGEGPPLAPGTSEGTDGIPSATDGVGENDEIVTDNDIPLQGQDQDGSAWALLNLILCLSGIILIFVSLFLKRRGKKLSDEDGEGEDAEEANKETNKRERSGALWFILSCLMATAGVIAFLLTENLRTEMIWIDKWTPLMFIILALEIICVIKTLHFKRKKDETE